VCLLSTFTFVNAGMFLTNLVPLSKGSFTDGTVIWYLLRNRLPLAPPPAPPAEPTESASPE
jgi:hypothetical protein